MGPGLTVRDWRYVVRVCNLDVSALATAGDTSDTSANLLKLMTVGPTASESGDGPSVWYAHQDVITALEIKLQNKKQRLAVLVRAAQRYARNPFSRHPHQAVRPAASDRIPGLLRRKP